MKNLIISFAIALLGAIIILIDGHNGDGFQELHWYGYLGMLMFLQVFAYLIIEPILRSRK